ncbi:hypothetical protein ACFQ1M_09750 [Sungkyunkwania multivorans]|uniref:Uncharacterized protein n=1 Tax=Sungkyunkwania multivorans TaxID=1173618 RepID=A0ABW3CXH0_9FLAO
MQGRSGAEFEVGSGVILKPSTDNSTNSQAGWLLKDNTGNGQLLFEDPNENVFLKNALLSVKTNRETITAAKTLDANSPSIQNIENTTAGALNVNLPTVAVKDRYFRIMNRSTSLNNIVTNTVAIAPGSQYEVVYDGTAWIAL